MIFDNGADENKPPPATLGPVVDTLAFLPCESEKFNDAVNPGIEKVEDTGVVSIPPEADVVFVAGATDVPKEITDDGPVGAALAVPNVTAIIREQLFKSLHKIYHRNGFSFLIKIIHSYQTLLRVMK